MNRKIAPCFAVVLTSTGCGQAPTPLIGVAVSTSVSSVAAMAAADHCGSGSAVVSIQSGQSSSYAEDAVKIADGFARNPAVMVVVGHSNSAASIAAASIYQSNGMPQIAPTTTAPSYSDIGSNMFRLVPDNRVQAVFLKSVLSRDTGSVVIAYVNDDYGRSLLADLGNVPGAVASIAFSETVDSINERGIATQIASERPGRLLWLGRSYPLSKVLVLLHASLPSLQVIGSDGVDAASVVTNSDGIFTGVRFVRLADPDRRDPKMDSVRKTFREGGIVSGAESLLVYDAVSLACEAIGSGAKSRSEIRSYLWSLGRAREPYQGVTGAIQFNQRRDVDRLPILGTVLAPVASNPPTAVKVPTVSTRQ